MNFIVYKITRLTSGQIYIGVHKTIDLNDGYIGSGKRIGAAIKKHGLQEFKKEILFYCSSEEQMYAKEKELVTEEFCNRKDTYNICYGGFGGFGYINKNGLTNKNKDKAWYQRTNAYKRGVANPVFVAMVKARHKNREVNYNTFSGKTHTEETKKKIGKANSIKQQGSNNSQFGTVWITNGTKNVKIKKNKPIPEGWYRGRV